MKNIVMLGTFHLPHSASGSNIAREMEKRLDYLRIKLGVEVLMEEWSDKQGLSAAEAFAKKSSLPWANVGAPDESRYSTHKGSIKYPGYHGALRHDEAAPEMCEYGPYAAQEAREFLMALNVQAQMENYESALLVLGLAHLHSVFGKLQSLGFQVTAFSWTGAELLPAGGADPSAGGSARG